MSTKLVYRKVVFGRDNIEFHKLDMGTYEPPAGWRVHSMGISESGSHYAGYIHLLLEASVSDGEPYR